MSTLIRMKPSLGTSDFDSLGTFWVTCCLFSTRILFWEQTAMRWGLGSKSLGHASYLILFRQVERIYKCIHSTNSHWFQKNCMYRESLNLTCHWETCKPLGSYCNIECQSRVNKILPTKLAKSKHLGVPCRVIRIKFGFPVARKTFPHLPPANLDVLLQSANRLVENALNLVAYSYLS